MDLIHADGSGRRLVVVVSIEHRVVEVEIDMVVGMVVDVVLDRTDLEHMNSSACMIDKPVRNMEQYCVLDCNCRIDLVVVDMEQDCVHHADRMTVRTGCQKDIRTDQLDWFD